MLYHKFQKHIDDVLDALADAGDIPAAIDRKNVTLEPPRDPGHGDLSTNAAMVLSKSASMKPRGLAGKIAERLDLLVDVKSVDIAGPGFINLRVSDLVLIDELHQIENLGADYGRSEKGQGVTVNVRVCLGQSDGPYAYGALQRCRCWRCLGRLARIWRI